MIGLSFDAPEHAIVLCCDEQSQVQALAQTPAEIAARDGARAIAHNYVRHDATTRFAAPGLTEILRLGIKRVVVVYSCDRVCIRQRHEY